MLLSYCSCKQSGVGGMVAGWRAEKKKDDKSVHNTKKLTYTYIHHNILLLLLFLLCIGVIVRALGYVCGGVISVVARIRLLFIRYI